MIKRWMRRAAALLALCLLMNSNVTEFTMKLLATEAQATVSDNAASETVSGDDVVPESAEENPSVEETTKNEEAESAPVEESEESGNVDQPESAPIEDESGGGTVSEGDAVSDNEPETEEDMISDNDAAREPGMAPVEEEDTISDNEPETETEEDMVSDNDAELDDTTVSDGDSVSGNDTVSDGDALLLGDNEYALPSTVEGYLAVAGSRDEFYLSSLEDFSSAELLCADAQVNGFEGKTLIIQSVSGGVWDITSIADWTGIGTQENPFKGTLKCAYANGNGVQIKINKPLLAYMGDGATLSTLDIVSGGSSSAVAQNISGTVTIEKLWIRGTIGTGSGTVGILAGNIASDSTLNVSDVTIPSGSTLAVTGTIAGGIAGTAGSDVTVTLADSVVLGSSSAKISITATEAAGGHYGVVTGNAQWDLNNQTKLYTQLTSSTSTAYLGGFAGKQISSGSANTLTVVNGNALEVYISGQGNGGGFVGYLGENMSIVKPEGTFTITGNITLNTGSNGTGGVIGVIYKPYLELADYSVNMYLRGQYAGGIVGEIQGGKCILKNVSKNNTTYGNSYAGTIIGYVSKAGEEAAAVELQGTINAVTQTSGGYKGTIVGGQVNALVYLSEIEGKLNGANQIVYGGFTPSYDEAYQGAIYRNQSVAGGKLIGDGTLANVGVINNTVAKSGDWYQLTSAADFVTLAIALRTETAHGSAAFGGLAHTDLLNANYTVTQSVDISYEKTGIITLNRNDIKTKQSGFCGKFYGVEPSVTITQNSSVFQGNLGIFSTLAGDAEFANLVVEGTIDTKYASGGYGGIAYQTMGDSLTLKNITMNKVFNYSNGNAVGGILGTEYSSNANFKVIAEDLVLAPTINVRNVTASAFIPSLSNAEVSLKNITLGGSITDTYAGNTGGFLGQSWANVDGIVENITVLPGTTSTSPGRFGVLIYTLSSKTNVANGEHLTLKNVKLNGLTVNASASMEQNALLVRDAYSAVFEVIDYDSTGCVVNNPGNYFDEIVGRTKAGSTVGQYSSGIVSIHSSTANFPEYHYENKVASLIGKTNIWSVYFYDVFQHLNNEDGSIKTQIGTDYILDTPEKVLLWNILHVANGGTVRNVFKGYLQSGNAGANFGGETYTFSGELDLREYSIYPSPFVNNGTYKGANNAKLILGAKTDSVDMGSWQLNNETEGSQHYGLHAGLFYNHGQGTKITMSDITFKGTIANLGFKSGVIMTGEHGLSGGGSFTNITFDDLWIADYNKEKGVDNAPCLMISKIPALQVTFEGIEMVNYPLNSDTKAAAALIGSAGGGGVTNLILKFQNMKIADDADGDAANNHNGDVLAYASFLFYYDYTDNAEINKGSGIYLFSEVDNAAGDVTYGYELDDTTEFSDTSNLVLETIGVADSSIFKPYVYRVEKIEVNPKTGDILKGCGTYEDPYIIEDARQFLTLARYMNDTLTNSVYQYQTFYTLGDGWKMIKLGNDSVADFCADKHEVTWNTATSTFEGTGADDAVKFGEAGFPTPEELSRAYFRLGNDIDLSTVKNDTYKNIAADFTGFGTSDRPFAGVWLGKDAEGTIHTVTLPDKTSSHPNYGFIQYAKGAVVKDLMIQTSKNSAAALDTTLTVRVSEAGGGVIGTILGGDNIIDNVTVGVDIMVANANASIGGYVGVVTKGGLILRNVDNTKLATFRLDQAQGDTTYPFLGSVVGKVEDGFVVYEGGTGDSYFWEGTGGNASYPAIPNYQIFNATKLKAAAAGITITISDVDITYHIPNAAALQVMSMALNSDSLSLSPSASSYYPACGYNEKARTRKANYSDIGCDSETADYLAAAMYDNVMGYNADANKAYGYPYLYDYLGITGSSYLTYMTTNGQYSILNGPPIGLDGKFYRINWNLAENGSYDMSVFGNNFRGIGAIYQTPNSPFGGTFRGNFDGKNSTITLGMVREFYGADITKAKSQGTTLRRVGLFNTIFHNGNIPYNVEVDFKLPTADASDIRKCYEIKNFKLAGSIDVAAGSEENLADAGGVVGYFYGGNYILDNITIDTTNPLKIGENGAKYIDYAGGLIGYAASPDYIYVKNCTLAGTESNKLLVKANGTVGGVSGLIVPTVLRISDTTIEHAEIHSLTEYAGGYIGQSTNGSVIFEATEAEAVSVTNSNISGRYTGGVGGYIYGANLFIPGAIVRNSTIGMVDGAEMAGGLIGYSNNVKAVMSDLVCDKLEIGGYSSSGGVIGHQNGNNNTATTLENVTVTDLVMEDTNNTVSTASYMGGVFGRVADTITIRNATVSGTKTDDVYSFRIVGRGDKTREQIIGGLIGYHQSYALTLEDCSVDTVYLYADVSDVSAVNLYAGGLIGYSSKTIALKGDIGTRNLKIDVDLHENYNVSPERVAGGCFGYTNSTIKSADASNQYYQGLTASGNTVRARNAGGLIGYNYGANTRFSGVTVENGEVFGALNAGGLTGYLRVNSGGLGYNNFKQVSEDSVNLVSGMTITGYNTVGGLFGRIDSYGNMRMENVTVQNNRIVSTVKDGISRLCGGLTGYYWTNDTTYSVKFYHVRINNNEIVSEVADDTLAAKEVDKLAVGGVVGKLGRYNLNQNYGELLLDDVTVNTDNRIGVRKLGTTEVKLVKKDGTSYVLTDVEAPEAGESLGKDSDAIESLEETYGYFVGSIVGMTEASAQIYMLRSDDTAGKFVTPVMTENPPVVDVGRFSTQAVDDYRKYIHVIYGAENSLAAVGETNLADMKAEYDKVTAAYTGTKDLQALLSEGRYTKEMLELFEASYEDSYEFPDTDYSIDFPILVYRVQNGSLQDVLDGFAEFMTNYAGTSVFNEYVTVTAEPKLYDGTTITDGEEGTASIEVTLTGGKVTYTSSQSDGAKGEKLSFTELTYTYGWKDDSGTHKKIFRLPIFVEEPIYYSVHSMIMEGKVLNASTIKQKGIAESEESNRVIMANDSDYTLYLEYTYGEAREKMSDGVTVEKLFRLEASGAPKVLPVGTQLLLVDVTDGSKAYYYTVQADNISQIKFSDFRDRRGNAYENHAINALPTETDAGADYYTDLAGHQLTGVGVERFLLSVLSNANDTESQVYSIHAGMGIEDEELESRFQLEEEHVEETSWEILAIPSLKVRLKNKGVDTEVSGEISRTEGINVKAAFEFVAEDLYWSEKAAAGGAIIDSSNNGKYMELAFYLRDLNENRVSLPVGTNVSYKLTDGSYSNKKVLSDGSIFYYYKDIRHGFSIPDFEYLVSNITGNTSVGVEFKFDFSSADLTTITEDTYMAWIELLRTANKEYPMGSGNSIDSYTNAVKAEGSLQLGFVLRADNLEDLAINTYPSAAAADTIPGHVMFDFSDVLKIAGEGSGMDVVLEKWSGFDYEVTYQIYKKIENGENVVYEPYTGTDIVVSATEGVTSSEAGNGSLKAVYNFTGDLIQNGNTDAESVTSYPCLITLNTASLTADKTNLTNYMLKATLVIKEKNAEEGAQEEEEGTSDFFIYTVTKLKLDL